MSKGGSAPRPPDPYETAAAQTGQSIGTSIANQYLGMVNQNTPYGSLTYSQTGNTQWTDPTSGRVYDIPQFTATQTLSPEQQRLQDLRTEGATGLAQIGVDQTRRLGSLLSTPMDTSNAPGVSAPDLQTFNQRNAPRLRTSYGDFSNDRQRVEQALLERMQPGLDRGRSRMESQLAAQGVQAGSEAYSDRALTQSQQENDARLGAILSAGQEQSRLQSDALRRAEFGNEANQQMFQNSIGITAFNNNVRQQGFGNDMANRARYMQETYAARNQPINEVGALLGTGQVQQPNFVNTPGSQMPTTDLAGLINQNYQNRFGAWQQQNQNQQGILGGLFGLGSAGIMSWPFG